MPGRIFSVNTVTAQGVPELFARNERVVCLFDTEHGPMAMVLVGAMIVASIETVWAGLVTRKAQPEDLPLRRSGSRAYPPGKGAEMSRFKLGSTVILLFGPDRVRWAEQLGH